MKTRWRDVAAMPPGPHTPHHTLGKLVTKASPWQPSSSVSMYPSPPALYPCIPALQLCIHVSQPSSPVSMYPGPAACRVLEPSSASARGYRGPRHQLHSLMAASTRQRGAINTSTASLDHMRPGMLGGYPNSTFGDASLHAGLQGEIVRFFLRFRNI